MGSTMISSTFNHSKNQFSSDKSSKTIFLQTDSCRIQKGHDTVDNPDIKKLLHVSIDSEKAIFMKMKYEQNRLYSFRNKWPLTSISPESLAEAGLFYLQHEDKVQCPFCFVILYNWTSVDKPLREHMKKSPKCPFLIGVRTGNVPLIARRQSSQRTHDTSPSHLHLDVSSTHADYKPKHSKMADIKRRLLTYVGWPDRNFSPEQLAECGLYYTGVKDVVTCFFCGGSLGNWVPEDDPWVEHKKFFPECLFLSLAKEKGLHKNPKSTSSAVTSTKEPNKKSASSLNPMPTPDITTDIVHEALHIFPEPLVMDAVKRKEGIMYSLQELCDDILQITNSQTKETTPSQDTSSSQVSSSSGSSSENNSTEGSDALLCKICMDNQRGVVFQPCGHFVSCWKCAQKISDCPLCRRPIINIIKTYFS